MKKIVSLMAILCLLLGGCYDDHGLWSEIDNIKKEISNINKELSNLRKVIKAQEEKKSIDKVTELDDGYSITFSDGTTITIKNGLNAPNIGVQEENGTYYWTLGGDDRWIKDKEGNRIPVAGKDGHTPTMAVDEEGYWVVDGKRVTDGKGREVKATGQDGDSFFQSVRNESTQVTFVLANGEEIVIPKSGADSFAFSKPEGDFHYYVFKFGETKTIPLSAKEIVSMEVDKLPEGWKVALNVQKKTAKITAPDPVAGQSYSGGIISLLGLDKNGATSFASIEVIASVDFTNEDGTFVVCEGNMTTVNGTIVYYDVNNNEYLDIFERANNGLEIGNVVQDMFIANGRIYIITQNGDRMGGAGRFVVCDARTMRMEYADNLVFKSPKGEGTWPQHLVICNDTLGYVQWSDSNMEQTSGIIKITLKPGKVTIGNTVTGTFGAFTTEGAIKTRLLYSQGKLYAACGHGVVIIDPKSNSVVKRITREGQQAKGIAKGANGHIFVAFAGTFTGSQQWGTTFTSDPVILEIDHNGNTIQEHQLPNTVTFPVATWSPAIGMCASFNEPHLYFTDTQDFNVTTASRYNYETKELDLHYVPAYQQGNSTYNIYGIMGVHPHTGRLWVGRTAGYVDSDIFVYDVTGKKVEEKQKYHYPTQRGASTAGIDFAYRFSKEFIDK